MFTQRAVHGITANRVKAEGLLTRNSSLVTALNPLIGYGQGAELVKEAAVRGLSVRDLALEKAKNGTLIHAKEDRFVSVKEIKSAFEAL
jgi:fumarate hydratase class II